MMDRFRFRAWNKEEKRMYYDAQNTYDYMAGKPTIFAESFSCLLTNDEEWEVEQCTGLKDKNGKLIYEGDIIKDRGGITYKIQWKDACFFAVAIDNFNYMPDSMLVQTWLNTWKAEIIGNVHTRGEE